MRPNSLTHSAKFMILCNGKNSLDYCLDSRSSVGLSSFLILCTYTSLSSTNDFLSRPSSIQCLLKAFSNFISRVSHGAGLDLKRVKSKPAPWLTLEIKAAMNDRDRQLRKFRRTNLVQDKIEYKHKRNHVNILLRKAKSNYNKEQLKENANDPDKFWKTIKSIYPATAKKNDPSHRFEINGEISSDENTIANGFKTFFPGIVHSLKSKGIPLVDFIWCKPKDINPRTYKTFLLKPATPDEVYGILINLRRKKATGTDGLPASFLKDSKDSIKHHLCHIINMSINTGVVPSAWKIARIIPIHKSGSTSDFDNYRPISVLPSVSKIIEKIVHKQLITFLEENKLIYSHQFGFRNKMCTELDSFEIPALTSMYLF